MSAFRAASVAFISMSCAVTRTAPTETRVPAVPVAAPSAVQAVAPEPALPEGVPDSNTPLEHDCHVEGWRFDDEAVQSALAERRAEFSDEQLSFVVFPNSEAPMIRETRRARGQCHVTYFGLIPDLDACQGVHYQRTAELAAHCCVPRTCAPTNDVWAQIAFLDLVDGISFRQPGVLRKLIAPGLPLTVRDRAGKTTLLDRAADDATIQRAIEDTPGWSGEITLPTPTREGANSTWTYRTAGGVVRVTMIRGPKPEQWYASSITTGVD